VEPRAPTRPLRPAARKTASRGARRTAAAIDTDSSRTERLAALGQRVAEVAHEVRNPLVPVKTFLDLLAAGRDDPELRGRFLEVARDELDRALGLLGSLIEQAAPSGPPADEVRFDASSVSVARVPEAGCDARAALEAVQRLLEPSAGAAGVRLALALEGELPPLAIERGALRQVLLNLVSNALEATPADGEVRLAARARGRDVEIVVDDCGPGIPPGLRRRVFEPFAARRADRPGGLGLSIAHRLVEQAGGRLRVHARPGGGARLRLRLPAAVVPA
jgi:signal transduction histidine kinase